MSEPTREDLLELLVQGQGLVGGARRRRKTRKGAVPPALKKWHAFRKKHPNLTIKQQSRLYKKQKRKGRGLEEDEEEEEAIEGFGMLGGAKSKYPVASSKAWKTKHVIRHKKLIKLGEFAYKKWKSIFPKEFGLIKKQATGSGIDFDDYMSFVVNQRKDDPSVVGVALRNKWDTAVKDGVKDYYSPYEQALLALGEAISTALTRGDAHEVKNLIYLLEVGEERDPPFAGP
jgi:hypothetical protein